MRSILASILFILIGNSLPIRVVQYNAEWLFMNYYSPAKCPGSGCPWANETEANTHIGYIADVVAKLNPDILNFCEVEGVDEMNLVRFKLPNASDYSVYLKPGTDTATGQNVGLMSRIAPTNTLARTEERVAYPLANSMCGYTGQEGTVGVSKHYMTEFVFYGRPTLFIALHLLAYPEDTMRCAEREAQAQVIQNAITEYLGTSECEIIVLGDLNDFDGRVLDANMNIPTSRVLDILKGKEGANKGAYELRSVAEKMNQAERFSDWWDQNGDCVSESNEFSMIDHILVSPYLFERIERVGAYHGYGEFCGKYDSDHYPLVVDFL